MRIPGITIMISLRGLYFFPLGLTRFISFLPAISNPIAKAYPMAEKRETLVVAMEVAVLR
jgi:hypothetical protein